MPVYFRDAQGATHEVAIIERRAKTTVIEYLDNARRGERIVAGRRYNHGTRTRIVAWNHELWGDGYNQELP